MTNYNAKALGNLRAFARSASGSHVAQEGLSKREYIAAAIMVGMQQFPGLANKRAETAVREADALLEELSK